MADTSRGFLTPGMLLREAIAVGVVALVLAGIHGVRWDESYEHSLIKLGRVEYPAGHPVPLSLSRDHTIQDGPQMALLALGSGPLLPNALRNWMFLMGTLIPVYFGAYLMTRKRFWASVAAVLALQEIYLGFDSVYNLYVWPVVYSYGPIGTGCALIAIVLLAAGFLRSGIALSALMIQIHIGQAPVLGLLCIAVLGFEWRRGNTRAVAQSLAIGAGIAVACAALWVWQSSGAIGVVEEEGPYYHNVDPWEFWSAAHPFSDAHRHLPGPESHAVLIGALILFTLLSTHPQLPAWTRRPSRVVLSYLGLTAAVVWTIALAHRQLGTDAPFLMLVWIPYRLMNYAAPFALMGIVGALATSPRPAAVLALLAALAAQLVTFVPSLIATPWAEQWIVTGQASAYFLFGAAVAILLVNGPVHDSRVRRLHLALAGAAMLLMALYLPTALFIALAGALLAAVAAALAGHEILKSLHAPRVVVTVLALAVALLCADHWQNRRHLPRNPIDIEIERYLAGRGEPHAILLTEPINSVILASTGHPALLPEATVTVFGYMPELGPTLFNVYLEVYGLRLMPSEADLATDDPTGRRTWARSWVERSTEDWRRLARRFGFDYVFVIANPPLQLPVVLSGQGMALYDARGP